MSDITLFEELTQLNGVSGYESKVKEYIKEKTVPYADEIIEDAIGNLIVVKKGCGENKKKIMLAAHMDEIGVQVIKVNEDGTLMIKSLGCSWIHTAYQSRVQFRNGVTGVIAARVRPNNLEDKFVNLYVDIGVTSKAEAMKYVDVGDVACYVGPYTALTGDYVTAKAIDDRVGCYMLMETLMNLKDTEVKDDIYFTFTVQEEEGCRGGIVTAERIKPDLGLAVDVTPGMDRPGDLEGNNTPGNGTAIKISDTSVICDEGIVKKMIAICEENQIKYQKDVIYVGGTDASAINLSNVGVKAGGVSVVTRYTHGQNCIVNLKDIEASIALLTKFISTIR